jgi:hypothetical protein
LTQTSDFLSVDLIQENTDKAIDWCEALPGNAIILLVFETDSVKTVYLETSHGIENKFQIAIYRNGKF